MNNDSREIMPKGINSINVKIAIISLFLMLFTQASFAKESVQTTPNKNTSSKCTAMKMKGNVVIEANSATVYTDEQDRTVIVLPKFDKKHSVLLKSDYQECMAEPMHKHHSDPLEPF